MKKIVLATRFLKKIKKLLGLFTLYYYGIANKIDLPS